ncbi:hypothetical protein COT51_01480 [candidate division WWE3 bacterium CG08_land_8_20_14_0_20_41_15]|uniref:Uncharacterized protein n=2 Tax=Katanobacteria TaxID=422282 RepID=A0A2H0XBW3_UNCKA|nr:MAG: hypothetical protein COT51_01480 [candidate division WWE3 bacterium CG08_land_8_20_14_0_20_41_15]
MGNIIINTGSLPLAIIDPELALMAAGRWGYDGGSLLLTRGAGNPLTQKAPKGVPILSFEPAFNPTSPSDWYRNRKTWKPGDPTLTDMLLFPDPDRSAKLEEKWLSESGATIVVHNVEEAKRLSARQDVGPKRVLFELSPGVRMTIREILDALKPEIQSGLRLDIDLWHLRRVEWEGESEKPGKNSSTRSGASGTSKLSDWPAWLFTPDIVKIIGLVDVQTREVSELWNTLWFWTRGGQETELARMLRKLHEAGYEGPYRVELHPYVWLLPEKKFRPGKVGKVLRIAAIGLNLLNWWRTAFIFSTFAKALRHHYS